MVLHDLNLAACFSNYRVAVNAGQIKASGASNHVMITDVLQHVFKIEATIIEGPKSKHPEGYTYQLIEMS